MDSKGEVLPLAERAEREGLKKRIAEMRKFFREQDTKETEYNEKLMKRLQFMMSE